MAEGVRSREERRAARENLPTLNVVFTNSCVF